MKRVSEIRLENLERARMLAEEMAAMAKTLMTYELQAATTDDTVDGEVMLSINQALVSSEKAFSSLDEALNKLEAIYFEVNGYKYTPKS